MEGALLFITPALARSMRRSDAYADAVFHDVSSGNPGDLSPFTIAKVPIPVPMQPYESRTVEGIWQGLKLIDGKPDFGLFESTQVRKRKHKPYNETMFLYGDERIGLVEARRKIYVPSYTHFFENSVPRQLIDGIIERSECGIDQYFYDVDTNPDIADARSSYSHASLVVDLLQAIRSGRKLTVQ